MDMKICSLALLTLLLAAPRTESQGLSSHVFMCCSKDMFIKDEIEIPAKRIKSCENTPVFCPYKAVRVETMKKTYCVDPELDWVQKCLKQKKKQKNSTNTSM